MPPYIILLIYYTTCSLQKNKNKIYCGRLSFLLGREIGDAISFRQQLSTTSFEAYELLSAANYPVHT